MSKITISNEDAIKRIKEFALYHAIKDLPNSMLTVEAFRMAIKALESNKCARWEWYEEWSFNGEIKECDEAGFICSHCKKIPYESLYFDDPDEKPPFEYCPHCGSIMTEDNKEGKVHDMSENKETRMVVMAKPQKQPFIVAPDKSAEFKKRKISKEHWYEIMKISKMFKENNK